MKNSDLTKRLMENEAAYAALLEERDRLDRRFVRNLFSVILFAVIATLAALIIGQ